MAKCIFCGWEGKLTHEHIWPDWLKNHIPKTLPHFRAGTITVNRPGIPDREISKKIGGDPRNRRIQCVCRECNNGWMSDIQQVAKPIVLRLMNGESLELNVMQQTLISSWVAMSVMCGEYSNRKRVAISDTHRHYFHRHKRLPEDGWRIWIGRCNPITWRPLWVHHSLKVGIDDSQTQMLGVIPPPNTQSTTYVVGNLLIHAISSSWSPSIERFRLIVPMGLRQIWPPRKMGALWPPRVILSNDHAEQIASSLFDILGSMPLTKDDG